MKDFPVRGGVTACSKRVAPVDDYPGATADDGRPTRRFVQIVVAALMLAGVASGGAGVDAAMDTSVPAEDQAEIVDGSWTVLHYSMADTDLEPFMMLDVFEMGDVGSNDLVDIVAMVDRPPDYYEGPVLDVDDWVGAKMLHVELGHAEELADFGDVDMSDPATLAAFITDGITSFPAAHYALVISDHGASWPGVGSDESAADDMMDLAEIQSGIATGLADAGVERLDLLGFDACLMATYEVATAMAPFADRLVASSEIEPGLGWDYHALQLLADDPDATADDLGTALLDTYVSEDVPGYTLALLDLTQMPALDEAMAAFTSALSAGAATVVPDVGRTLESNPGYGRSPDPSRDFFMTDLGALAATIGIEALDVSDQADGVLRALNDVVVDKVSGPAAEDFTGLSIYFPPSRELANGEYQTIPDNPSGWLDFLLEYFDAGASIPPTAAAAFVSDQPDVIAAADGLTATGIVDAASLDNLTGATISYGIANDDGSTTFYGDETAQISADGSGLVEGFYDLTVLNISDGEDMATAYISLSNDDETGVYSLEVPVDYYAPGDVGTDTFQDATLNIVVDANGNVTNETYFAYDPNAGTYGELTADPAGIIVPQAVTVDADGNESWAPTTDVGLYADLPNLAYSFERLETGTPLYVQLSVTDYGAHTDSIGTIANVP
jgi:hypothetical protein